jgi:hypothetical protein
LERRLSFQRGGRSNGSRRSRSGGDFGLGCLLVFPHGSFAEQRFKRFVQIFLCLIHRCQKGTVGGLKIYLGSGSDGWSWLFGHWLRSLSLCGLGLCLNLNLSLRLRRLGLNCGPRLLCRSLWERGWWLLHESRWGLSCWRSWPLLGQGLGWGLARLKLLQCGGWCLMAEVHGCLLRRGSRWKMWRKSRNHGFGLLWLLRRQTSRYHGLGLLQRR